MSPLLKPIGLVGGTLLVLLLGRKAEAATLPPLPAPGPLPPAPGPVPPAPGPAPAPAPTTTIPLGSEGSFPAGAILGMVANDSVRMRANPTEQSASLGVMARGTLLELFADGHSPATPAAPQGWERVRAANGLQGFVAAQFLTGAGIPGGPRETQGPDDLPASPLEQTIETFAGAPPRAGMAFFSPMIGARAPAYGQAAFVPSRRGAFYRFARAGRFNRMRG